MDLIDLRVLAQVVADGSFSRAAASLHLAQPAVSRRVALLEAELGAPLFVRGTRRLALTSAGRALLPYVTRSLRLVEEGRRAARTAHDVLSLSLAAPASIAPHVFPAVMAALRDAPMNVACRTAHTSEVKQMVLDGAADAGFVLAGPAPSGLRTRVLHRDPVLAVAQQDHPLAAATSALRVRDLCAHPIAFFMWGPGYLEALDVFERNGLRGMNRREVSPAAVARDLVLEQGCLSLLPRLTVRRDLTSGNVVVLPVQDLPSWTWDIAVVYRRRKKPQHPLAHLLRTLGGIDWAGGDAAAPSGRWRFARRRPIAARLIRRPLPARSRQGVR